MSKNQTNGSALDQLIDEFLTAATPYSVWEVEDLSGVNHETVARLRRGELWKITQGTQRKMREFVQLGRLSSSNVSHGTVERAALLVAADRLERMAAKLRAEAMAPLPREAIDQAKEVAAAVLEVLPGKPQKRAGRKGSGGHR